MVAFKVIIMTLILRMETEIYLCAKPYIYLYHFPLLLQNSVLLSFIYLHYFPGKLCILFMVKYDHYLTQ